MIKNFLVTGDTHGRYLERVSMINTNKYSPKETAIIILGDFGADFYLNKSDDNKKDLFAKTGFTIYAVRGNHEERPANLNGIETIYDENVNGNVWYIPQWPRLRYFKDGDTYKINNHSILICPGAYSVDKWYRINRAIPGATWTGWFPEEQLTMDEMNSILSNNCGKSFDFIFAHTCPIEWQPTDLFLSSVNQLMVDNSTECWLSKIVKSIDYNIFLFGHYHDDRLVRPHVEMYYTNIENLEDVWNRWNTEFSFNIHEFNFDKKFFYPDNKWSNYKWN